MKLRDKIDGLKDRLDQLEERERKLLLIFASVLGVMLVILVPLAVAMSVSSQSSENDRVREIIHTISDERLTLGRRQLDAARVDARYKKKAPALAGFLAQIADKVDVEIPETQDRSTVPHGKSFKERVTKIRLRKVGMLKISNFMDAIESSGYAVSISRLVIRKNGSKPDEFDAEMEISAFDREEKKKNKKDDSNESESDESSEEE